MQDFVHQQYLQTFDPKVGTICILGALGYRMQIANPRDGSQLGAPDPPTVDGQNPALPTIRNIP